ncbi:MULTISPECIES: hypothetical protein [unclassified Microcoleus]|nr:MULTISPECIES: hypothetical protein [unclassified Microcoleus]
MSKSTTKITVLGATFSILATLVSFPLVALANNWAGPERRGSCFIPRAEFSFECKFGPYNSDKQIGGFYVNPEQTAGYTGPMPFRYRVNGGNWQETVLIMGRTGSNYIDFGNGVSSFEFLFPRSVRTPLGTGESTINFTMNYDLD